MQNEKRLSQKITERHQHWELLNEKLVQLRRQKVLVTSVDEKFHLEKEIEEIEEELNRIDQQLSVFEDQVTQNNDYCHFLCISFSVFSILITLRIIWG